MIQFLKRQPAALVVALIAIAALAFTSLIGVISFMMGKSLGSSADPTLSPSLTPPFPVLHTATPTARPTETNTPLPTGTPTATPTPTPTSTPTPRVIITEIRALGRLETAKFIMQTVIDLHREPATVWEEIFGTDKLLLVAAGEVVAGFDLTLIAQQDINVRGDRVTIVLPPPQILYSKLDNDQTYVYEQKTGLFRQPDKTLEGEARQLAEQAMLDRALEGEILRQAEANGKLHLEAFLRSLGFTEIAIIVRSE